MEGQNRFFLQILSKRTGNGTECKLGTHYFPLSARLAKRT